MSVNILNTSKLFIHYSSVYTIHTHTHTHEHARAYIYIYKSGRLNCYTLHFLYISFLNVGIILLRIETINLTTVQNKEKL